MDPTPYEEEILTSEEACRFLKIGRTKLWELTKNNEIPAYKLGRAKSASLRYKRSELMGWLERNRIQKATGSAAATPIGRKSSRRSSHNVSSGTSPFGTG